MHGGGVLIAFLIFKLLLIVEILLAGLGQMGLKKGIENFGKFSFDRNFLRKIPKLILEPFILLGVAALSLGTMIWMAIISQLDLSYVYPMEALSYFFVTLFSIFLFKETVTRKRWMSIGVIVLGVIVLAFS